jgi:hypothetical protein
MGYYFAAQLVFHTVFLCRFWLRLMELAVLSGGITPFRLGRWVFEWLDGLPSAPTPARLPLAFHEMHEPGFGSFFVGLIDGEYAP